LSAVSRHSSCVAVGFGVVENETACTIAVARRGQQRSLARPFQILRVAIARSPRARILAWVRLTAAVLLTAVGLMFSAAGTEAHDSPHAAVAGAEAPPSA
jgi:hypothetical protein